MGGLFLALRGRVLDFVQCFGEVVGHQNFACPKAIVTGDGYPTLKGASPVDGNGVQLF